MTTHENSRSRPGAVNYRLNGQSVVKKWFVADPKIIFQKIRSLSYYHWSANPPWFHRNRQELAQNQKFTSEGFRNKMRADMRILGGLLFMWDVVPNFLFRFSVAASQKTWLRHSENGNKHFSWDYTKIGLHGVRRHPRGARSCPIRPCFDKLCHDQGRT
jgi:hypothetical protein